MAKKGKGRVIGFAMDAGEMRAVELLGTPRNFRVTASGAISLPRGLVSDGLLADIPALGSALSKLLRENGFSNGAPMLIGIKNQNVLLRMATFPSLPEDKLRQAVLLQSQQFIPVPVSELMLDFVKCDSEHKEGAPDTVNVLLVGAKKTYLDDILEMCKLAGRTVADIDSAVLANFRAAAAYAQSDASGEPAESAKPAVTMESAIAVGPAVFEEYAESVELVESAMGPAESAEPDPYRAPEPALLPGSYVEPAKHPLYPQNMEDGQTGAPTKDLYMVVDIDHETTAMTIGYDDVILMTRTAAHSADFLGLASGWHGSLSLPREELERLASYIGSDIQSSLQYYSMIDRAPVGRVYITGRFEMLDDIIAVLNRQGGSNYIKPELYPFLAGIGVAQFSTCISLAARGLENERT